MPGEWETFYFMLGGSAAALIGLLFVVVTLRGYSNDATRLSLAQRTFITPVVLYFVTIVIISSAAVMPELPPEWMAVAIIVPSAYGIIVAAQSLYRLFAGRLEAPHWTDYVYYGVLPAIVHLWLIGSAIALWRGAENSVYGLAVGVLALLLLGIRDAWDLATWLSAHQNDAASGEAPPG